MTTYIQDAKYALRQLRKNLGFTIVSLATLALATVRPMDDVRDASVAQPKFSSQLLGHTSEEL